MKPYIRKFQESENTEKYEYGEDYDLVDFGVQNDQRVLHTGFYTRKWNNFVLGIGDTPEQAVHNALEGAKIPKSLVKEILNHAEFTFKDKYRVVPFAIEKERNSSEEDQELNYEVGIGFNSQSKFYENSTINKKAIAAVIAKETLAPISKVMRAVLTPEEFHAMFDEDTLASRELSEYDTKDLKFVFVPVQKSLFIDTLKKDRGGLGSQHLYFSYDVDAELQEKFRLEFIMVNPELFIIR